MEDSKNKTRRRQLKALTSKDAASRQVQEEPVLVLHGQSPVRPEIEAGTPAQGQDREGSKSKMHKVEVMFQAQLSPGKIAAIGRQATEIEK